MSLLRSSLLTMLLALGACGESAAPGLAPPVGPAPGTDAVAEAQAEFERVRALEAGCCTDPDAKGVSR